MDGQMSLSDLAIPEIYVKSQFSGWRPISEEAARIYATQLYRRLPERLNREEEINNRLRGTTYAELTSKKPEHTTATGSEN